LKTTTCCPYYSQIYIFFICSCLSVSLSRFFI